MKLTVPKAAKALGISENAVRQRAKRGQIRTEKKGGRVYVVISPKDLAKTNGEDQRETNALAAALQAKDEEIVRLVKQLEDAEKRANDAMGLVEREQAIVMSAHQRLEQLMTQKALPSPGFFARMFGKSEDKDYENR